MNKPPFDRGQLVRYNDITPIMNNEERTVDHCELDRDTWRVYFTNGAHGRADSLEAVPSPVKVGDTVTWGAKSFCYPVLAIHSNKAWVGYDEHWYTVSLDSLIVVPDTVKIEVARSVAIAILTDSEWYKVSLKEAARKALGQSC